MSTAKGIPLKDRDPADVKAALSEETEYVVEQFVKLHEYARANHLGITSLGHQTGIGGSILSQAYNHSYPGDYTAIAGRIETFFWRLEQKEKYGGLRQFVETRLAASLWEIFEKTRIIRRIQIIQSPEQLGKTRAAVEYTERNNSGRTVYVQLAGGTRSGCGDFIWELAERLDIPYTIKLREKRIRIKQKLATCDLVIIDESHLLASWSDNAMRDFWDYLRTDVFDNGARGVVLISTNCPMLDHLKVFKRRARYNTGQLLGRMRNQVVHIDPAEDITPEDIAALVGRYYQPSADMVKYLHTIATAEHLGHFGLLEDIMNESWTRAKAARKKLTDSTVKSTAQEIIAELKDRPDLYK